ncbi:13376_t:CDS:2 [Entrophospora sp. SA101]|nr:13376_t:CDS:2 [Entrophospora sp. SA101]CAJ0825445.1 7801_t:CDS:2 [Entrophospora sp. SA101]CAJ0831551.1 13133_t:CDS:2 [Entrophospora sp. SA101]CAJ0831560.1 13136_t:CDS:2 [Entrophospora sp. SA101]CAJ0889040.1 5621_t:CDS:2 [Entrophospora sp. SA101]
MKGPSSAAKPGYFFYHQANEETRLIFNRRPFESTGPSIFLYNEVFGLFLQDFKDVSIPNDFYKWTKELLWIAASGYKDEKTRQGIMMEKFQELWGVVHKEQNPDNSASDGVLTISVKNQLAYKAIFEIKNEVGSDKVVVEPLTDMIFLADPVDDDDKFCQIIRLFVALTNAFDHLHQFYSNSDTTLSEISLNEIPNDYFLQDKFFPYIREFIIEDKKFHFTYDGPLTKNYAKPIWKARLDDNTEIVVKFAKRYNSEAHKICYHKDLAPGLIFVSENIYNGFYMIIMKYIDGIQLDNLITDTHCTQETLINIYKDIKIAIDELHCNNIVFADLRPPNILIRVLDGKHKVTLVVFDWCGRDRVDRYPASINWEQPWHNDVKPNGLLKKEYDYHMLDQLKDLLHELDNGDHK